MKEISYEIVMLTHQGLQSVGVCKGTNLAELGDSFEEELSLQLDSAMFRAKESFGDNRLAVVGTTIYGETCKCILYKE
jgi:hypothetical protein